MYKALRDDSTMNTRESRGELNSVGINKLWLPLKNQGDVGLPST